MPKVDLTLRRNGKQQACEPCRKLKLKCDHGSPYCGRCVRRQMTDRCIYHPAPMTKSKSATAQPTPERMPIEENRSLSTASTPRCWDTQQTILDASNPSRPNQTTLFKRAHTEYGTTSFSAVFSENRAAFGALFDVPGEERPNLSLLSSTSKAENMRYGIEVIRNFPSRAVCDRLLETLDAIHESYLAPEVIKKALDRFRSLYAKEFENPQSCDNMSSVVVDLIQNGKLPMRNGMDIGENETLLDWLIGPRLRWEMLGLLFSFFGMAFFSLQEWDPIFDSAEWQGFNRQTAAWRMKNAADGCLQFCWDADTLNEVVALLMMNVSTLHSVCSGDESDQVSRRFSQVIDAHITLGLHRLPTEDDKPTPLAQWRRLLFASADFADKGHSSFHARPPMLLSQFCRRRPFLDLSSEIMYSTPAQMREALSKIDANGWNTSGEINDITWARALFSFCPIREEILILSLGIDIQFPPERIDELLHILDQSMAQWPAGLRLTESLLQSSTGLPLFRILRNHVEYLQNKFLLERLRVARCNGSGQGLLNVSQDMMRTLLNFWLKRDQLSLFNAYFDWMVVCYGIPAAGVLCMELLKTTRSSTHPIVPLRFSRSSIIQDLTMFIGFLDWIRPTDGNYALCSKLRKVVRRILDNVLDPPHPQPSQPISNANFAGSGNTTPMNGISMHNTVGATSASVPVSGMMAPMAMDSLWMPPMDDGDCLNWLEGVDWTTQGYFNGM